MGPMPKRSAAPMPGGEPWRVVRVLGAAVTIVGAGAIGGVLGARMTAAGLDVLLVDKEAEHVAAMNRVGLRISGLGSGQPIEVRAAEPRQAPGELGIVFLAVKAQHTREAMEFIAPRLRDDGVVVSFQNGLVHQIIESAVGVERTLGAFVHYAADYQEPGHIMLASEVPVRLGEPDGRITPRLLEIAGLVATAMPVALTRDIHAYVWGKMCYGSLAFAAALVDQPYASVVSDPRYQELLIRVTCETGRVAEALGHQVARIGEFDAAAFQSGDEHRQYDALGALAEVGRTSLKQYTGIQRDLMVRRRPTEVEFQPAAVERVAHETGLEAPLNGEVARMILEVERGEREMHWQNLNELAERCSVQLS